MIFKRFARWFSRTFFNPSYDEVIEAMLPMRWLRVTEICAKLPDYRSEAIIFVLDEMLCDGYVDSAMQKVPPDSVATHYRVTMKRKALEPRNTWSYT